MNYCRRCGSKLVKSTGHEFTCSNNHTIYANSAPAVALLLTNNKNELAVIVRAIDPGKGKLDFPGGFCDGEEPVDKAVSREIQEEIGLEANQYSSLKYLHSGIDHYKFDGESIPVVSIIFSAVCTEDVILRANDDAETAQFMPIEKIRSEYIYFSSLREAFDKIVSEKTYAKST